MNILLTGASGQVGGELAASVRHIGNVVSSSRKQMDLIDPDQIRDLIRKLQPGLIVNAAAYTDVEKAESEPALAMLINGDAPGVIAQEAQRVGAALIHYSTDYVFDGTQAAPYAEGALPNPLNAYGRSKLAGEQNVIRHCEAYWILRCSWIYSTHGRNFLTTMGRLLQERHELHVVDDQIGAPTWARRIARVTADMLQEIGAPKPLMREEMQRTAGIYHLAAAGATSWHGMSVHILHRMKEAGMSLQVADDALLPVPTSAYPTVARRPLNSLFDTSRLQNAFRLQLPDWRDDMDMCLGELLEKKSGA